jgi:uncharacterized protein YegL
MPTATKSRAKSKAANPTSTATKTTDVVFVLDRSGSMDSCRQQAIDSFNEHVDTIRQNASLPDVGTVLVSLIDFNDDVRVVFNRQPLDTLQKLTASTYQPMGSTAMLNGLDCAIELMRALPDANDPQHSFLIPLITDGWENASHAHEPFATYESIAAKVTEVEATGRWTFSIIGANIDLANLTSNLNIPMGNAVAYTSDRVGTQRMTKMAVAATANYFAGRSQGRTSTESFMADVTGGASHVDDVQAGSVWPGATTIPTPPYQPSIPPQPVTPPRVPKQPAKPRANEGQMRGGKMSGAPSPLLGGTKP